MRIFFSWNFISLYVVGNFLRNFCTLNEELFSWNFILLNDEHFHETFSLCFPSSIFQYQIESNKRKEIFVVHNFLEILFVMHVSSIDLRITSSDKISSYKIFDTKPKFRQFFRFLPDFCIEILDKIFDGQNFLSAKIFDTKPKFRQFCPKNFFSIRYLISLCL